MTQPKLTDKEAKELIRLLDRQIQVLLREYNDQEMLFPISWESMPETNRIRNDMEKLGRIKYKLV